jgi:hypothetical protein
VIYTRLWSSRSGAVEFDSSTVIESNIKVLQIWWKQIIGLNAAHKTLSSSVCVLCCHWCLRLEYVDHSQYKVTRLFRFDIKGNGPETFALPVSDVWRRTRKSQDWRSTYMINVVFESPLENYSTTWLKIIDQATLCLRKECVQFSTSNTCH